MFQNTFIVLCLLFVITGCEQNEKLKPISSDTISIIPQPKLIEASDGVFIINKNSLIQYQGELKEVAQYLSEHLTHQNKLQEFESTVDNQLLLTIKKGENIEKEGYELTINKKGIKIEGDAAGVFYGVQSLIQLLVEKEGNTIVPFVHIIDKPRFEWRGMLLDVSRHFFDVAFIKQYIDILAKHKLNIFHWHLTDDQGWRIAIDAYPKLTEVAAWRAGDGMEKPWDYDIYGAEEGKPRYGGFYTKDDVREILAYAKKRYVTVVPEIELPAHSWSAIHAYPNLSCTGKDWHRGLDWSFSDPFCAGNEETFQFLENVLTEVIELFPSEYIHIGGDEAQKTKWEHCVKCQARIKNEALKNEEELQSYFINRIEKFVNAKGRKTIGWDEILEGGLAPNTAVMSWRGETGGIAAAKLKHEVVMTPAEFLYFNAAQSNPELEGVPNLTITNLEKVYQYNPIPKELNEADQKYIKGVEACLWSEHLYSEKLAIERLLPRVLALSEIAWLSNEEKNWNHFQQKLSKHLSFLDRQKIDYYIPPPTSKGLNTFVENTTSISLEAPAKGGKIYYTLDGSPPSINATLYDSLIVIKEDCTLKAINILPSGKGSAIFEKKFWKIKYVDATNLTEPKKGISLSYYKGGITQLSDFDQMKTLKKTEIVSNFKMPEDMPKDKFGLKYNGYIKIPSDGIYTFFTNSDDGSGLYINDEMVVDNDGTHGMEIKKGEVALRAGFHKLGVSFFENTGGEGFNVRMQAPAMDEIDIPSNLLFYK